MLKFKKKRISSSFSSSQNKRIILQCVCHSHRFNASIFKQIPLTSLSYMAANNTTDGKRFVFRSSDKKSTSYKVTDNESKSQRSSKNSQPENVPKVEGSPSPQEPNSQNPTGVAVPARRVVVIRNTKHADINQEPVDLEDFERKNPEKVQPVISDGVSIYLIELIFVNDKNCLEEISVFYSTTHCTN